MEFKQTDKLNQHGPEIESVEFVKLEKEYWDEDYDGNWTGVTRITSGVRVTWADGSYWQGDAEDGNGTSGEVTRGGSAWLPGVLSGVAATRASLSFWCPLYLGGEVCVDISVDQLGTTDRVRSYVPSSRTVVISVRGDGLAAADEILSAFNENREIASVTTGLGSYGFGLHVSSIYMAGETMQAQMVATTMLYEQTGQGR